MLLLFSCWLYRIYRCSGVGFFDLWNRSRLWNDLCDGVDFIRLYMELKRTHTHLSIRV